MIKRLLSIVLFFIIIVLIVLGTVLWVPYWIITGKDSWLDIFSLADYITELGDYITEKLNDRSNRPSK